MGFTIDSWVRSRVAELWSEPVEAFAERRYRKFGPWAPSVFWFEITRYWHDADFAAGAQ